MRRLYLGILLLLSVPLHAEMLFQDMFEYPLGDLVQNAGWNNVLFPCPSPAVTDEAVAPGMGRAVRGTADGYSLRMHPLPAPVDVTAQTLYISGVFRQVLGEENNNNGLVTGLANSNALGRKIEIRFYPNQNDITVTGYGDYAHVKTPMESNHVYQGIIRLTPIAGESEKVMVDVAVVDITDQALGDEDAVTFQVRDYEFSPSNGNLDSPFRFVTWGCTHRGLRVDDLRVATSWNDLRAVVIPEIQPGIADGGTDVPRDGTVLSWTDSPFAATYDVYFGRNAEDVNTATPASPTYLRTVTEPGVALGRLDMDTVYHWRVDEVNDTHPLSPRRNLWKFRVEPTAIPLTGVTVTASDTTEDPNRLIDGSGLANGLHDSNDTNMWKTAVVPTPPVWLEFDLGDAYKVHSVHLWNHNTESEGLLGLGTQDLEVTASLDGLTWGPALAVQLPKAPGAPGDPGTEVLLGDVSARYVRFVLHTNWATLPVNTLGLAEVRFEQIPTRPRALAPATDSVISPWEGVLSWRPGRDAAQHEVLFGPSPGDLELIATVDVPRFDVTDQLVLDGQYAWQVREVNEAETVPVWTSDVQTFSTLDTRTLDRMDQYRDSNGLWIWQSWTDGYDNPSVNGAVAGHGDLAETEIYRSAGQSLPLAYDNTVAPTSLATHPLVRAGDVTDWRKANALVLYIYGKASNVGGTLYFMVGDTKVVLDGADLTREAWTQFNIDLPGLGIDLSQVPSFGIGIDGKNAKGTIYVDDVILYAVPPALPPQPLPSLLANGSFEEYDPHTAPITNAANRRAINAAGSFTVPGWTCTWGNSYVGFDSHPQRPARDGDRYAFVNNNGIATFRSDDVPQALQAGDTLRLVWWAASNGDGNPGCTFRCRLILDAGLSTERVVSFDPVRLDYLQNHLYKHGMVTHTLAAPAQIVAAEITMDNTGQGDQPRMDDVRLSLVP